MQPKAKIMQFHTGTLVGSREASPEKKGSAWLLKVPPHSKAGIVPGKVWKVPEQKPSLVPTLFFSDAQIAAKAPKTLKQGHKHDKQWVNTTAENSPTAIQMAELMTKKSK